ncbi:MAG: ABC transporter ATP-binding protein [Desulfuromusa sp.]|nr:ABC transporter ATP-binding protein [Desulfuromusa sp.]
MITVEKLVKTVKKKQLLPSRKTILNDVSFRVQEGKVISIIGQNGAGKSTVIKSILGFTQPDSGTLNLRAGTTLGYLPENPYYYDYLTLRELLWFSASSFGMKKVDFPEKAKAAVEQVGMQAELGNRLRTFSKGMTQRAGIAAAIVHDPDLLIFDEPMSGLDPVGRQMVFDLISGLRDRGKTILFCSHVLSDVERLCDEVIIMHAGEVRRHLTREDLVLAQKETEILVPLSAQVKQILTTAEYRFKTFTEHLSLYVETDKINQTLDFLRRKEIPVVNVQSSAVTLEKIFYDVVADKEESCGL